MSTGRLNEAVDLNRVRFPADFKLRLTAQEVQSFDIANCDIKRLGNAAARRARGDLTPERSVIMSAIEKLPAHHDKCAKDARF